MTAPAIQRPHPLLARTFATVGPRAAPDPTRPTSINSEAQGSKKGRDRNALYIGGGLVGVGAIWYYYAKSESARIAKEQEGSGPLQKDTVRSDKERAQEFIKSGDAKYQEVKAEAQSKVQAGRDQLGQSFERGKQRFEEGVDQAARRAAGAQSTVEQKVDEAKSTGKGWLSWGKAETRASADELKRRANETQEAWNARFEEAKRKAAEKGEEIKQRVGETEEEFRDRIAKAIQKR
ncbi:hypothetical protein DFH94DRAFT_627751 [Russula ochroleuca]|uniref:Uncharacterized protein n=1 Tax=Russula ochroleuca TaxID=152965 RepID=A0A9P5TAM0_9AGAM|nr:hypothetical protein DFH94DRAFT_627751 [Russula ochroleuca]